MLKGSIMHGRKMLVVEDDRLEIQNLSDLLKVIGVELTVESTVNGAVEALEMKAFDFLLTDLHIETKAGQEEPDGIKIIKTAREHQPTITIVANSSDPRTEVWNLALQAGAHHFIRKPFSKADEILIGFDLAKDRSRFIAQEAKSARTRKPSGAWKAFAAGYPHGIVIGERDLKITRGIARTMDASFVIMGETGTGKEEIAKLIHRFRREQEGRPVPFIAVNCASISGHLAESQLFGHRKGAFTGADQNTAGFIAEADGGILFLDEIHTLDIPTQQRLLRVLNDGTYHRLGETRTYKSQFQLLAASTRDLDDEVHEGRLLMDIRSRIMGLDLRLPPLRERKQDIPALTALFLSRKGIDISNGVFDELVEKLQTFYWSGNIRQMFKAIEAWILTCEFEEIPLEIESFPVFKGMLDKEQERRTSQLTQLPDQDFAQALTADQDLDQAVSGFEKAVIVEAMKRHKTIGECCKALNVNRSTLDAKRRKFGIL